MADEPQNLTPEQAAAIAQTAAAAINEVISNSVLELVLNATENDLEGPDESTEVRKGTTGEAQCWVHAPALFQLSALAWRRLGNVAEWAGVSVKEVRKVRARFVGKSKVLLLRAAEDNDRTAYDVQRHKRTSGALVNLFDLLATRSLAVTTGYRERFDVFYVPKESALWPGLLIDLGSPQERRLEPKRKKRAAEEGK